MPDARGALARAGLESLLVRVASSGLVFLATLVVARSLGPEAFGIYALAVALLGLLAVPMTFGLAYVLLREVPAAEAVADWGRLRGALRWARATALCYTGCAVAAGGLVLLALHATGAAPPATLATFALALAVVPAWSASEIAGGALRGFGHVAAALLPEQIVKPMLMIGAVLALAAAHRPASPGPQLVMAAHLATSLVAAALAVALLRGRVGRAPSAPVRSDPSRLRASLVGFTGLALAQALLASADLMLVAALAGPRAAGMYRIALQGALIVALGPAAVTIALSPRIVRLHARGDTAGLTRLLVAGARAMAALASAAALVLAVFARPLLATFFGHDYAEATTALSVLCLGQVPAAALGVAGTALALTGHEAASARALAAGAAAVVLLALALIPLAGIAGAAAASALGTLTAYLIAWRRLRTELGIDAAPWRRLSASASG